MKHTDNYKRLASIDGSHPLRHALPTGYIDYAVRRRRKGRVLYFNFPLARDMGLLSSHHPDKMNAALRRALLDTFSLQIINEYDLEQGLKIPARDRLPGLYMATRYLQIQHPSKRGTTSGDGRGLWNGVFKGRNAIWDISSNGTGTTALSPAVANEGRFIQTGDKNVSYGNGRACLSDGVCAAMMSEIYHRSDIATERTLAIIAYADGTAINVRASKNLLRPAHFFMHIKQNNLPALVGLIDYYIDRQVHNEAWPKINKRKQRYNYFLASITQDFARMAAKFESDYIFCWLDWDGDNILMNGGIIDYGSLRQFGLFHHDYRYDDVDRMSTTITEQKNKARYIIQTFVQIVDALLTGKKKNIKSYSQHSSLKLFDKVFLQAKNEEFFYRMGIEPALIESLLESRSVNKILQRLRKSYNYFERSKSSKGLYPVSDGVSWDAIYCMRDCMREMPGVLLANKGPLNTDVFLNMIRSRYANDDDVIPTAYRRRYCSRFQQDYQQLVNVIASVSKQTVEKLLLAIQQRSATINRYDRITGDAIIYVAEQLIEASESLANGQIMQMFNDFVNAQVLSPEYSPVKFTPRKKYAESKQAYSDHRYNKHYYQQMLQTVIDHRDGL